MTDPNALDPVTLLAQQGWVESLARGLVRDSSLAQDLAQEAWLRVSATPPREAGALRGFVAGVVRNLKRSERRATLRRSARELAAARPEALPSPAELVERAELQRLLVESVLALDEGERTAILLRYFENLSAEEIAARSDLPAGTVRSRLSRGLERLRERLEARVDRRDLFAGLCALARLEPLTVPLAAPNAPASLLPWLGGLLAMKTLMTIAAGCAGLLTLAAGLWLVVREPAPRAARTGAPLAASEVPPLAPPAHAPAPETPGGVQRTALVEPTPEPVEPVASPAAPVARVHASVLDEQGHGLPGVEVRCDDQPAGASAADGRVELELSTRARPNNFAFSTLEFRHPDFALARRRVRLAPEAELFVGDVTLAPAARVRGWVEDERGQRVPGAQLVTVGLENPRTDPEELRRRGPEQVESSLVGETGPDGSFELAGVPLGALKLWAGQTGFAWSSLALDVPREGVNDVVLTLRALDAADRISGRVLSPAGEPVPGAEVYTWYMAANVGAGGIFHTDADGRFEILLEQRVAHDLTVQDPEKRWSELYRPAVEPGTHELELRFEPARWLEVRVADPESRPVPSAKLSLESAAEGNQLRMEPALEPKEGLQDGHGRLRVPNARFRVVAEAVGFEQVAQGPFESAAPPASLDFRLAPLPGIRGVVLTSEGVPSANAKVGLYRLVSDKVVLQQNGFRLTTEAWSDATTTTGADGRFVLYPPATGRRVSSSEFVLRAEAAGHARTELPPRAYDAHTGVELELRLVRGGAIEGRAETARGVEPTGLLLGYHRGDGDIRTLRLGPDGRYRLEGLTPGPWTLAPLDDELFGARSSSSSSYYEEGAPPMPAPSCFVVDGETTRCDVDFSAFSPCTLRGELALDGRSTSGWTASLEVRHTPDDLMLASVELDERGRFELVAPRGGKHRLVLRGPEEANGRLELAEELELEPGERAWSLALRPGRLEGSGAVGRGTRERFYRYEWSGNAAGHALTARVRIVPDADGRFVLPTLPEGGGRISRNDPLAQAQEFAPWEVLSEFSLAPGGAQSLALP